MQLFKVIFSYLLFILLFFQYFNNARLFNLFIKKSLILAYNSCIISFLAVNLSRTFSYFPLLNLIKFQIWNTNLMILAFSEEIIFYFLLLLINDLQKELIAKHISKE